MIFVKIRRPSRSRLILTAAAVILVWAFGATALAMTTDMATETDRNAFLKECGYETAEEYVTDTVTIPADFNQIYQDYNALQRVSGYDLSLFRGKTVTRYTYTVLNVSPEETVLVHLLVSEGTLIGGDMMNPALDGWMKGLPKR